MHQKCLILQFMTHFVVFNIEVQITSISPLSFECPNIQTTLEFNEEPGKWYSFITANKTFSKYMLPSCVQLSIASNKQLAIHLKTSKQQFVAVITQIMEKQGYKRGTRVSSQRLALP